MNNDISQGLNCPVPMSDYSTIVLAHGGGGKMTHQLIERVFKKYFTNEHLDLLHDGAMVPVKEGRIAMTTDSYVVSPIVFPGGNIGELAVNGTVNDLAMCGAHPQYLTASFILEEGLALDELERIVASMAEAAKKAGVVIVTGDTKVVPRGKADKIFITTSGVGTIPKERNIHPTQISVGDKILVSGTLADHGMAIMSVREGLEFESEISSDTAALNGLVEEMYKASLHIHFLRDPTRGGLASTLNEIASSSNKGIQIVEQSIPVKTSVRSACEILGFDPLYVANEGKLIAIVASSDAAKILTAMRNHPFGKDSAIIGEVTQAHAGVVVMQTAIGGERVVDMISGEQLPRIC
ncbi:MAG: hydrogenase expression/formation protein HypE [Bacteroidota bacterium]|nr:hydrogenase expression/formation protein HypE [Bacteroidota bacterium]